MPPLYRFSSFLLLALLCANLFLYAWFADRTWETSSDEIIQKAYIISRLLSESAGRSIAGDTLNDLEESIAEALKDRHIVSVTILDNKGKVIIENATPRTVVKMSTFETPVMFGKKSVGTLVTRFSPVAKDERITSRLRKTAALQLGLLSAITLLLALFILKEKRTRGSAGLSYGNSSLPHWGTNTTVFAPEDTVVSPLPEQQDLIPWQTLAGNPLVEADETLSTESDSQRISLNNSCHYLQQLGDWQMQALETAGQINLLIATGEDIVNRVKDISSPMVMPGQELSNTMQSLREKILYAMTTKDEEYNQAGGTLLGLTVTKYDDRSCPPGNNIVAAADMMHVAVEIMQKRAFPAFAEALGAGENIKSRLTLLIQQIDLIGDNSCSISRCCADLFDLAEATRMQRRIVSNDKDQEKESSLNHFADQLETIAVTLRQETRELLSAANDAAANGKWTLGEFETSKDHLVQTGAAIEDAAAASIVGGNFLYRGDKKSENIHDIRSASSELKATERSLNGIHPPITDWIKTLINLATEHDQRTVDCTRSLDIACENLRMAIKLISETSADIIRMATLTPSLHDESRPISCSIAVEQLVSEACPPLPKILPKSSIQTRAKRED